jgi:hypothetical protein
MRLHGTQVCKHAHRRAHGQQALLGADLRIGITPLRAADSAEQHRIGFSAELSGGVGEGVAMRIDGNAPDQRFLVDEAMLVLSFNGLEYAQCLGHHLGADAIAGQYADQGFHARSLSKRVMASD